MTMEILNDCASSIADITNNNHIKPLDCLEQVSSKMLPPATPHMSSTQPVCVGCNCAITDQYVMKVQPDLTWHMGCLKCSECNRYLDETCTCFFRGGKVYCKTDFHRLFSTACATCGSTFTRSDFVMRADRLSYHIDCFRCTACSRQLIPGDEFSLREDSLYCKEDSEVLDRNQMNGDESSRHHGVHRNMANGHHKMEKHQPNHNLDVNSNGKLKKTKDGKPTRVRTVLSEKQLHTLRTCYGANPRPDALMKEQLVELTGLSPRVIRVWFQNKRCKDKKKSMLLKHMQQQEKNLPSNMQGVAMVAQSPMTHESGLQAIDSYHHHSWKRIPDYPTKADDMNHNAFTAMMGPMYGSGDESAVYLDDDVYMDCAQPSSVSSQFSRPSLSPNSSV